MLKWSDIEANEKKNNILYFKLQEGESCIFRPLGLPHHVLKYMVNHKGFWRSAICENLETCPVALKHNILPKDRWLINGIDRRDNKIKVFESSPFVFKNFKEFYTKTGKNPGGTSGANYKITAKKVTYLMYDIKFSGVHSLDDNDKKIIENVGLYDLKKLYAPTSKDLIEKKLFGEEIFNSYTKSKERDNSKKLESDIEAAVKELGL